MHSQLMQPEQALFLLDFLLPQLKSEQAITHKIISAVPADRESYRPDAKSMTAFELAKHIAAVEIWFLDGVISTRSEKPGPPPARVRTCGDVADWYASNVANPVVGAYVGRRSRNASGLDWLA
jgi:hypothetical protein